MPLFVCDNKKRSVKSRMLSGSNVNRCSSTISTTNLRNFANWSAVRDAVLCEKQNDLFGQKCWHVALYLLTHDDVIKWKHFPRYWPFVRGIHRSPMNSSHKGQWRGALMLSLICVWINGGVNNRKAGDLIRYRAHYDAIVMKTGSVCIVWHLRRYCVWTWYIHTVKSLI